MRPFLFFVFMTFTSINVFGQVDIENLKSNTQEYIDAYLNNDYEKMAINTHPNIVSLGGGKKFVADDYKTDRESMENLGFKYISGRVGEPGEIYESGKEMLCFVPQILTVTVGGNKYESTTYLLASSSTKGNIWTFVALDRYDSNSIKSFIPNYTDDMPWPENSPLVQIN